MLRLKVNWLLCSNCRSMHSLTGGLRSFYWSVVSSIGRLIVLRVRIGGTR